MHKYYFIILLFFSVPYAYAEESSSSIQVWLEKTQDIHSDKAVSDVLQHFDRVSGKSRKESIKYSESAFNAKNTALLYQLYFSEVLISQGKIQSLHELEETQFAERLEYDDYEDFSLFQILTWSILQDEGALLSEANKTEAELLRQKHISSQLVEESLTAPQLYRRVILYPEHNMDKTQLTHLRALKFILLEAIVSRSYEDQVLALFLSVLKSDQLTDEIAVLILSYFNNNPDASDVYIKVTEMRVEQLNLFLDSLMTLLNDDHYAGEENARDLLTGIRRPEAFDFLLKETEKKYDIDIQKTIYRSILNIKSDKAYTFIAERLLKVEAGDLESDVIYHAFLEAFNLEWIYPRLHQKILLSLLEKGNFSHISFYGEILFQAANNSKRHLQLIEEVQRRKLSRKLLQGNAYHENAPFYKYLLLEGVSSAILENKPELAKAFYYESQKLDVETKSFYQIGDGFEDYPQTTTLSLHNDFYVSQEVSLLLSGELERILEYDIDKARKQQCPFRYLSDRLLGEITNTDVAHRLFENTKTGEIVFQDDNGTFYYFDGYTLVEPPFEWLIFNQNADSFNVLIALMDSLEWLTTLPARFLGKRQDRPQAIPEVVVSTSNFYENLPPFTASVLHYEDNPYSTYIREYAVYGNVILINSNLNDYENMQQYIMRFPDTRSAQAYLLPLREDLQKNEELQANMAWVDNRDQLEKNQRLLVRGYQHPDMDGVRIITPIDNNLLTQSNDGFFCKKTLAIEDITVNEALFRQRERNLYQQGFQLNFIHPAFNCRLEKVWDKEKTLFGKITRELEEEGHEALAQRLHKGQTKTRRYYFAFEDSVALGKSKLGGLPDLPQSIAWPIEEQENYKKGDDNKYLQFIAQLNFADFNHTGEADYLPRKGLLFLFRNQEGTDNEQLIRAIYAPETYRLTRRELPKAHSNKKLVLSQPMRILFVNELSTQYPYRELLQDLYLEDIEAATDYERILMQYERPYNRLHVNYPEKHVFGYSSINHGYGGIFHTDKKLLIDLPVAGQTLGIQLMEDLQQMNMDVDIHYEQGY